MRQSKRTQILDAAFRVVQRAGVRAVTFESVAAESGLTKGGLLYHFPSREALLEAMHGHMAQRWEEELEGAVGGAAGEVSARERSAAYAAVTARSSTRAELLLMLEGANEPAMCAPWHGVLERWAPAPVSAEPSRRELEAFVHRLAADGLWLYESLAERPLDPRVRRRVAEYLAAASAEGPEEDEDGDA
ncbi:TetR family transcriptional regulator [Murinocardiopsis flavida]|uniref:TetR family transcriptional regulator n=1 Tax=Murinocardiopsis flavida TaxID=645275 RepID=A0A2P8DP39_9ACTN|nr:TetR/AcrR family transcriptional regulator [Murinocardiopsis flavida]PSK98959.1 TetR family transcriptional regulator [Murinocardiopsis flavida]